MAITTARLNQNLIDQTTIMAKGLNRTSPKKIEHWAKTVAAEQESEKLDG